jgi:hypothetical protein
MTGLKLGSLNYAETTLFFIVVVFSGFFLKRTTLTFLQRNQNVVE